MDKKIFFCCCTILTMMSCNTEKINLSPVTDNYNDITGEKYKITSYTERANQINYMSEITNLLSSFPKFTNDAVNIEISKLKEYLNGYIGGMQSYDLRNMEKSYNNYQRSYKKLQKLKPYLNQDEADILNRYLVRIKTNMNVLEDTQQKKDTVTLN